MRDPAFTRFWTAFTVSDFGTYVTAVALPVLVVSTLHGSAFDLGVIRAAQWLPYLAFGLLAGALVDRRRRQPLLVWTNLGRGAVLAVVPALWAFGGLDLAALAALMIAFGTLALVGDAAAQSFLPRLVPVTAIARANARLDQSDAAAQTAGPALGGALVAAVGAPVTVLIDAVSYFACALLTATLAVAEPDPVGGPRRLRAEIREGLAWVYRHRTLAPLSLGMHGWFFANGILSAVLAPYALRTLHLGSIGLGAVLSVAGVGGLLGALAAPGLGERLGTGWAVIVANATAPIGVALIALAPVGSGWAFAGAGQLLFGLGMGVDNANSLGYRQAITPDRLQGRVNATVRSINRAVIVVAAPLGGWLGDTAGLRFALWVATGIFLAVAVYFLMSPLRTASISAESVAAD